MEYHWEEIWEYEIIPLIDRVLRERVKEVEKVKEGKESVLQSLVNYVRAEAKKEVDWKKDYIKNQSDDYLKKVIRGRL